MVKRNLPDNTNLPTTPISPTSHYLQNISNTMHLAPLFAIFFLYVLKTQPVTSRGMNISCMTGCLQSLIIFISYFFRCERSTAGLWAQFYIPEARWLRRGSQEAWWLWRRYRWRAEAWWLRPIRWESEAGLESKDSSITVQNRSRLMLVAIEPFVRYLLVMKCILGLRGKSQRIEAL